MDGPLERTENSSDAVEIQSGFDGLPKTSKNLSKESIGPIVHVLYIGEDLGHVRLPNYKGIFEKQLYSKVFQQSNCDFIAIPPSLFTKLGK